MPALARLVGLAVLMLFGQSGHAQSSEQLLFPFPGPIAREDAVDALCMLPPAVGDNGVLSMASFEELSQFMRSQAGSGPSLASRSDRDLLSSDYNLVMMRGVDGAFFEAAKWRAVALRADLCLNSADRSCKDELRVTLQPFTRTGMFVVAHDMALHLFFSPIDRVSFTKQLSELKPRISDHVCSGDKLQSASLFLKRFTSAERMTSAAWMISSKSGQQWTFGRFEMRSGHLIPAPSGAGLFENFSKPLFLSEECPINRDSDDESLALFRCTDKTLPAAAARLLQRMLDPVELRRPTTLCVSCHYSDNLKVIQNSRRILNQFGLPVLSEQGKDLNNLRQFGYDHLGYPAFSVRTRRLQEE